MGYRLITLYDYMTGNSSKATILGGTVSGVVLFILILVFWLLYRLRKAKNTEQGEYFSCTNIFSIQYDN